MTSGPLPAPEADRIWQSLRDDFIEKGFNAPWPRLLSIIGLYHLLACLICHWFYSSGNLQALPYLTIWAIQLFLNIATLRRTLGKGWSRQNPIFGILTRVWLTFLIISFSVTSYSEISADQANTFNWFKPAWASLACFAWAVTAWLVNPWFVFAAVWTWGMGWMMIYHIHDAYLIYGFGWASLLWMISVILQRRTKRQKTTVL